MEMIARHDIGRIDTTAELACGAQVEPGAVIGPHVQIGAGTRIAAGAVIGARVVIGRASYVGARVSIANAIIGDNVIVHSGARIGQDGFEPTRLQVPRAGRAIIQNDVEIGANTTIDRGTVGDTVIGEGSKIDNLVQIEHDVVVGRHCIIVAMAWLGPHSKLDDFVVMGGQSGTDAHITLGEGAQISGAAFADVNMPARGRYAGAPAKPLRQFAREQALLKRLAGQARENSSEDEEIG
jgi:UDP-3-O-[3-hydroxymyristoyl] glucosamine N-acyltransferase